MATFTVTTLLDSDPDNSELTLREAIEMMDTTAGGDRIEFADGLSGTIVLEQGSLELMASGYNVIDGDIDNDGISDITISGGGTTGVFTAMSGRYTLQDLMITDGMAESGAGIWVGEDAFVRLLRTSVTDSEATGEAATMGGGGIYSAGEIELIRAEVSGNTATAGAGSGGNIFAAAGDAYIGWSTISEGEAARAGGGIEVGTGTVTIENSRIVDNTTGAAPGNGGGLHVTGPATVDISNSLISGNVASSEGGGLWNNAGSTMTVTGSVVSLNDANGDAADNGGGGIFNNGGTLVVEDSSVNRNTANGEAGSGGNIFSTAGMVSISDTMISGGTASRAGGGVEIIDGDMTIDGSTLTNNRTGAAPGNGGALHVTGTNGTNVTVSDSMVTNNWAASEGGGLWNNVGSTLTVMDSVISGNAARGAGADNGGGGLFNNGGTMVLSDVDVTDNRASGASGSGGGLLTTDGMVTITDSTFDMNTASRAGGGIEIIDGDLDIADSALTNNRTASAPGNGGALHVTGMNGTTVDITGTMVTGNFASSEGGGLWNNAGSTMTVTDSMVSGNTAAGMGADNGGGGLFNNGGTMVLNGVDLMDNRASQGSGSGGGLLSTDGDVTINDGSFEGNTARRAGGAIEIIEGDLTIDGTGFTDNMTGPVPGNGGAIHITGAADSEIMEANFTGNYASAEGGAVWNSATGTMAISGTVFMNNTANGTADAEQGGGAVFSNGGDTMLSEVTISDNTANRGTGPGILGVDDAMITVSDSMISDTSVVLGAMGDTIMGGSGSDGLRGSDGMDSVSGGMGDDRLFGLSGDDMIMGDAGDDMLYGNAGADMLTGGDGMDSFVYFATSDSPVMEGRMDMITDFMSGDDMIDLSRIDADTSAAGDQAFMFIGDSAFSGTAGELSYAMMGGETVVMGDTDGDAMADFQVSLAGSVMLTQDDFLL